MKSICSVLDDTASALPDKALFIFPATRTREELRITYGQLAERATAAGHAIADLAEPGERALLLFPAGPDFWAAFMGCLCRGIIAVPLHIPNINRTSEFLQNVCDDCNPTVVITDQITADLLRRRADRHPWLIRVSVITPDRWNADGAFSIPRDPSSTISTPAFIQYTSGSTSRPRGVKISHQNLISNLEMISRQMEIRVNEDRGVTWLPHYHDMGLVGGYLATLYSQNTTLCLPPEEFAIRPARWLELISESRATVCGGPNFAYQLCSDKLSEEQISGLDLSSWRVAYVGAERIRPDTIDGFTAKFSPAGFRSSAFFPCYGLGEATLFVTGGPASSPPLMRAVSTEGLTQNRVETPQHSGDITRLCGSGQTIDGTLVTVVTRESDIALPEEHIGEVYVSGPSVSQGYWGSASSNEGLFRSIVLNNISQTMLRTGDVGFLSGGELFITGRAKELIIIRGKNLHPEDIEDQVKHAHESLSQGTAAAFAVDRDDQEALIIVAELNRAAMHHLAFPEPVIAAIRQRVVECFGVNPLDIQIVRPATIPHTSSGKPRRLAVRDTWLRKDLPDTSGQLSD